MRSVRFFWSVVSILLLLAVPLMAQSNAPTPLSQEQLEAIAIQPATNWSKTRHIVPEMLPLFKAESIQFGGKTRKYRLHTPDAFEVGKKYPMILWLHGAGERGDDNELQLVHLHHIITYLTGEKKRDFFLLVPQYASNEVWGSGGPSSYSSSMSIPARMSAADVNRLIEDLRKQTVAASPNANVSVTREGNTLRITVEDAGSGGGPLELAYAIIEQVAKEYPVDRNRITVSGLSTGGDGTWHAIQRRPNLFAAGAPLANWVAFSDKAMAESPILKKIPVWSIYSSDDGGIDRARAEFDRVERAGANVRKTEFGICGHTAWTPAMLQADIFAWLLSRAKDGDRFYAVYDPGVNPDDMKGIVDVATRDPNRPTLAPAVERQPGGATMFEVTHDRPVRPTSLAVAEAKARGEATEIVEVQTQHGTELVEIVATRPTVPYDQVLEARERARERTREHAITAALQETRLPETGGMIMGSSIGGVGGYSAPQPPNTVHTTRVFGSADDIRHINEMMATAQGLPPGQMVEEVITLPDGSRRVSIQHGQMRVFATTPIPPSPERDKAYAALAEMYFQRAEYRGTGHQDFKNCARKMSPQALMELIPRLVHQVQSVEGLKVLEELLDGTSPQPVMYNPFMPQQPAQVRSFSTAPAAPARPASSTTISAERIIEECDRPWAMTSESLYGMFAADWHKEAEAIPDFVVNLSSEDLAKHLAKSVGEDAGSKDFIAACRSILSLTNKPMSSPWFETSGGRLRSEIQYSLSPKGQTFVRFLRVVADSGNNSDKARELSIIAKRTLEKIDLVLAK